MRTALVIIMLLAAAAAVFYVGSRYEEPSVEQPPDEAVATTTPAAYFAERIVARGVADIGQPIEGFDAQLLMLAFPGITPADFDGTAAREGSYTFATSTDELTFVRTESEAISSAERMLTEEGYAMLLANLEMRLGMRATTKVTVDALIDRVDTGERLEAGIGERTSALGVWVTPREVLEDSRCPADVACVRAGTVRVRATLESGLGSTAQEFELMVPITTEAEEITLVQVAPLPAANVTPAPAEYVFTFQVAKR